MREEYLCIKKLVNVSCFIFLDGDSKSFVHRWVEPYLVKQHLRTNVYLLERVVIASRTSAHAMRMRPYIRDKEDIEKIQRLEFSWILKPRCRGETAHLSLQWIQLSLSLQHIHCYASCRNTDGISLPALSLFTKNIFLNRSQKLGPQDCHVFFKIWPIFWANHN